MDGRYADEMWGNIGVLSLFPAGYSGLGIDRCGGKSGFLPPLDDGVILNQTLSANVSLVDSV